MNCPFIKQFCDPGIVAKKGCNMLETLFQTCLKRWHYNYVLPLKESFWNQNGNPIVRHLYNQIHKDVGNLLDN